MREPDPPRVEYTTVCAGVWVDRQWVDARLEEKKFLGLPLAGTIFKGPRVRIALEYYNKLRNPDDPEFPEVPNA